MGSQPWDLGQGISFKRSQPRDLSQGFADKGSQPKDLSQENSKKLVWGFALESFERNSRTSAKLIQKADIHSHLIHDVPT